MLLCIDVGNTNIVMGVLDQDKIVGHWRVRTEKDATSDELGILICNLFQTSGISMDGIEDIIISCVVPPLLNALEGLSRRYFNLKPMVNPDGIGILPAELQGNNFLSLRLILSFVALPVSPWRHPASAGLSYRGIILSLYKIKRLV